MTDPPMVYTPFQHIPVAEVFVQGDTIYLKIKKSKSQTCEVLSLDQFLSVVIETLQGHGLRQ